MRREEKRREEKGREKRETGGWPDGNMTRLYSRQVARARLEFDASRALKSRGLLSPSLPLCRRCCWTQRLDASRRPFSRCDPTTSTKDHANFRGESAESVKVAARHPWDATPLSLPLLPMSIKKLRMLYCRRFLLLRANQRMLVLAVRWIWRATSSNRARWRALICYAEQRG